jgi:uncharacterized membrane protein
MRSTHLLKQVQNTSSRVQPFVKREEATVMSLGNRNLTTLLIAILGAVKLILQAFGVDIITSQQVDDIANGIAALVTVIGVIMTHLKRPSADRAPTRPPR